MSKILTAEESINNKAKEKGWNNAEQAVDNEFDLIFYTDLMIEFAKYHVQQVKEEMSKKFADQVGGREGWGNEIIMSVYPLDNIK